MNRILAASAILVALTGAAAAESTVIYSGNYDGAVLNQYAAPNLRDGGSAFGATPHGMSVPVDGGVTVTNFDIHSGQ